MTWTSADVDWPLDGLQVYDPLSDGMARVTRSLLLKEEKSFNAMVG
jgi:hypothetical protein